jgi:hypothetical protein
MKSGFLIIATAEIKINIKRQHIPPMNEKMDHACMHLGCSHGDKKCIVFR